MFDKLSNLGCAQQIGIMVRFQQPSMAGKPSKVFNSKFDGTINFDLCQVQVRDVLIRQGLQKLLRGIDGKSSDISKEDWDTYDL